MTPPDELTPGEVLRRLHALEEDVDGTRELIGRNRENEVLEHITIRKEIGEAFDRVTNRLWIILGGVMASVLGGAALQVFGSGQ